MVATRTVITTKTYFRVYLEFSKICTILKIESHFNFITSNILLKIITAITTPSAPGAFNQASCTSFKQQYEGNYQVILFQENIVIYTDLEKVVLSLLLIFL